MTASGLYGNLRACAGNVGHADLRIGARVEEFSSFDASPRASSETLAREWKPYLETCIEAFGAARCMFESNFPVDSRTWNYATLWKAFKRSTTHYSIGERTSLFSGTAARVYRLSIA